ncbi:MAG: polysaccharide deacetylase family protein [Bacteroidia bacterium]|jgi:hypothetical protein
MKQQPDVILVHVPRLTARCKYIMGLLLRDILGLDFTLTDNATEWQAYGGYKFSYGKRPISEALHFTDQGLVFESGIKLFEISETEWKGRKAIFSVRGNSALPFDVFAASFYMVSRYEEYMPHKRDKHGRFLASQSIAFKLDLLSEPIVNYWANDLLQVLELRWGTLRRNGPQFKFVPTVDIDNAYAYKHKGFIRAIGGLMADLSSANLNHAAFRLSVLFGIKHDPYDTYDYQMNLIRKYPHEPIYFFLLGDFAQYDRNVPHQNRFLQTLVKQLDDVGICGIHPSYRSNENLGRLKMEVARLSAILHREITLSRQHFLKFQLPATYQNLLACDITDDYSMGYAEMPGFRAGIASPFMFYDLDLETETPLKIHPVGIMDGTLKDYMNLEPDEAEKIIYETIQKVKSVQGEFVSIWHNESFAENQRWKGWRKVYETLLKTALNS